MIQCQTYERTYAHGNKLNEYLLYLIDTFLISSVSLQTVIQRIILNPSWEEVTYISNASYFDLQQIILSDVIGSALEDTKIDQVL